MKIATVTVSILLGLSTLSAAQTTVRFVPQKRTHNDLDQPFGAGKIEQIGQDFSQKLRVELPQKTLVLTLKPSPLKQYATVITSEGEVPSEVDFYEADHNNQRYYLATVNKRFRGLLMAEGDQYISLEKTNDSLYTYQPITSSGVQTAVCDHLTAPAKNDLSRAARRASVVGGCFEFPVGFVSDYAHYKFSNENIANIEVDNLLKLAVAQEIWGPFIFDANVTFKAVEQVIQTDENNSPWPTNALFPMSRIWGEFHNSWNRPAAWKKYKSLIRIGLTGTNFGSTDQDRAIWGYGGGSQNEFGMGTMLLKGFKSQSQLRWLFAHELGHVFGAGHDDMSSYVMNPDFYYAGSTWSPKSKAAINGTLTQLDTKKLLLKCPALELTYAVQTDSLVFAWQTNYDSPGDSFSVDYSADDRKTWTPVTKLAATGSFSYQYTLAYKLSLGQATHFRVRQQGDNDIESNIVTVSITGSGQESAASGVSIYPNPVANQLTVKTPTPDRITVVDLSGKQIQRIPQTSNHHVLDTSSWAPGFYFIQVDNKASTMYKVVK